jgi:hypothetical protein
MSRISASKEGASKPALGSTAGAPRAAAIGELKSGAGDPESLEPADPDASEDFTVSETEDGDAALAVHGRSRGTEVACGEDTDSFAELAEEVDRRGSGFSRRIR